MFVYVCVYLLNCVCVLIDLCFCMCVFFDLDSMIGKGGHLREASGPELRGTVHDSCHQHPAHHCR